MLWVAAAASVAWGGDVDALASRVDWDAVGTEAVSVVSALVQAPSINPPGREDLAIDVVRNLLEKEGIPYTLDEFAPGRHSLVARLRGASSEPGLCLMAHLDVVPADSKGWTSGHLPFSGDIADGYVWGRGAMDMKGLAGVELTSFILTHRLKVPLERDLVLVMVGDEEVSNLGVRHLAANWTSVGCSQVINEGGFGVRGVFFPGQTVFGISSAEKGVLWVKVTAQGAPGHGSTPLPNAAPQRLLAAVNLLNERRPQPRIDETLYTLLHAAGTEHGGITGSILRSPALVRMLVRPKMLANPGGRALLTDSCNLTGFSGAEAPNVVPAEVSAVLDCRMLPGTRPEEVLTDLRRRVPDPNVRFDVLYTFDANRSPIDDPFFAALARRLVEGAEHAVAGPVLSLGSTDSQFLRPLGVHAYGISPFEVEMEELERMHGVDERLSTDNIRRGVRRLWLAVMDVLHAATAD